MRYHRFAVKTSRLIRKFEPTSPASSRKLADCGINQNEVQKTSLTESFNNREIKANFPTRLEHVNKETTYENNRRRNYLLPSSSREERNPPRSVTLLTECH